MDEEKNKRGVFTRICISILWLIPIVLVIHIVVGALVGAFAGSGTTDFDSGYQAGQQAGQQFFMKYGKIVLSLEFLLWIVLSFFGILPGTSKYKRKS